MAQGCLMALLIGVGKLMVCLGYGSRGMEARESAGMSDRALSVCMSLLAFVEFFCCIFAFGLPASADQRGALVMVIVLPALYIAWVIYARISAKKLIQQHEALRQKNAMKAAAKAKEATEKKPEVEFADSYTPEEFQKLPAWKRVQLMKEKEEREANQVNEQVGLPDVATKEQDDKTEGKAAVEAAESYTPEEFKKLPAWKRVELMKEQEKK